MEKIQQALEKARARREAAKAPEAAACAPARGCAPANGGSGAFAYRETRVVAAPGPALRDRRVISGLLADELGDTFRVLRTQVLQRMDQARHTTLAVVSPGRGEGKSLTAANLAVGLAMQVSRTVLLVDVDLRRPAVHRYFGIEAEPGLVDHLVDDVPLARCLVNPGLARLVLLPAGRPLHGSSELLTSPKMIGLAAELKARYPDRIVVYDLPPMLASDDAIAFLTSVEDCLLVVQDGLTRKDDVKRAIELLNGCRLIGTVLNRCRDASRSGYYRGY